MGVPLPPVQERRPFHHHVVYYPREVYKLQAFPVPGVWVPAPLALLARHKAEPPGQVVPTVDEACLALYVHDVAQVGLAKHPYPAPHPVFPVAPGVWGRRVETSADVRRRAQPPSVELLHLEHGPRTKEDGVVPAARKVDEVLRP